MNAATLCFSKFMLDWAVSTSVHMHIPQSAHFSSPLPIHSCPGWLVCICNTCKSFLQPPFLLPLPLCTQSSLCVERDRHQFVSHYNSFHPQTDTVTNSGNWYMGLTQRGILTLSLDPRGSWVFCTLCVFSTQSLVHCCMHTHPLCFTSPCTTMLCFLILLSPSVPFFSTQYIWALPQ